ncbi:MASE4 domain-containing protein [Bradyrhizobium sp. 200]|uniref:MASE4 domain-containing protein n=1 Tax=Bradyrhizobium sp. 200 TaxID=2782665 RepID=UPI001FFF631D|nr:MASE4 domain-containing protein [Bradyrhizobium sp. 200]
MMSENHASTTLLTDLPPTRRQTRAAIAIVVIVLIAFAIVVPFSDKQAVALNAFFPSLDAIVLVTDLITAVLLYAQFSISRSRSLLILASGYFFTALIVIPHALTFSGAFSPTGLFGAGLQTGSWLFIFWHIGFAAALLGYAMSKEMKRGRLAAETAVAREIGWSAAAVVALVGGITWLTTGGEALLPPIILDASRLSPFVIYPIWFTILITAAGLVILVARRRSVLDLWLIVVAAVFIGELAFSGLLPTVRFSVGFYAGRVFSLFTSSVVLIVLLAETTLLYVHLARSNTLLQRERHNKLMSMEAMAAAISHELNQPMGAALLNSESALICLKATPPEIDDSIEAVESIVESAMQAKAILSNLRSLFGGPKLTRERVDLNSLSLEVLKTLRPNSRIRLDIKTELASGLPPALGHKGQLQEVITNLIHNAVDAMNSVVGPRALIVRTEREASNRIAIAVEDRGPGVSPLDTETIFDAFVTTKPNGMGLGLAISRMIVERHEGTLSVSRAIPHGAIFRVTLPMA